MIVALSLLASVLAILALSFGRFARSTTWRATVTPLASIIGSGFLICGPILANEFGAAAFPAMAMLLLLAYAVGAVIRFNIIHVENLAPRLGLHDSMRWTMRITQLVLALAYAVSVAYYLKLLAEFLMKPFAVPATQHGLIANVLVTAVILMLTALTFSGSIKKIEHAAHASVSVKMGMIAGMLMGLAVWWLMHADLPLILPEVRFSASSIPLLLGLLVTVQGFETSRYLGGSYDQMTRVRSMRYAQWISSLVYLAFLGLLTPFLLQAQQAVGVAGILDIMKMVAPFLAILVLIGAVSSQLSAAIADSIGSGGLIVEVSGQKFGVRSAFMAASALSIAVVWLTDPFQVIALASRAFAVFYALQAVLAIWVARRSGVAGLTTQLGFAIIFMICVVAAVMGAPAES